MSLQTAAPFGQPSKLDKSRLEQLDAGRHDSVASWRKNVNGSPRITLTQRSVLSEVKPNINPNVSIPSRSTSKPSSRLSAIKSIPRPAASPDVFAPDPSVNSTSRPSFLSNLSSKRLREPANADLAFTKRVRVEEKRELADATAKSHKLEEEKWTAKWIKVFPTLVLHFEIGAEEGQGKSLVGRVIRMGAVSGSEPIFKLFA